MTMLIRVGYDIAIEVPAPTPILLLLDIHGSRRADIIDETFSVSPDVDTETDIDFYGNRTRRCVVGNGVTTLSYRACVRDNGLPDERPQHAAEVPITDLPISVLHFLSGSRYCETDKLGPVAWELFGKIEPGLARVEAITKYVHDRIAFDYQQASATRTASDVHDGQVGVCRDYTHLAIALCRCLNIPARYVNGYLGDIGVPADPAPMDFSAWFEAYIGHKWITFDARHNQRRIGRIVIARGRDAADVAMLTSFGQHRLAQFHIVCEEAVSSAAEARIA